MTSPASASQRSTRRHGRFSFLRSATAHRRLAAADRFLALVLAFIAGAINAGGFLALGTYTSHMTGLISAAADNLVLGSMSLVGASAVAVLAFTIGAGVSAFLINWARRHDRRKQYALPIVLEALLLLGFGVLGSVVHAELRLFVIGIPLLCLIMGLQNATITKLSGARMRTTHMTGMVTDIGIELGKLVYRHADRDPPEGRRVVVDTDKLFLHARLVGLFFLGGVTGALGFGHLGFIFTVPLSLVLLAIALPLLMAPPRRRRSS